MDFRTLLICCTFMSMLFLQNFYIYLTYLSIVYILIHSIYKLNFLIQRVNKILDGTFIWLKCLNNIFFE